MSLQLLPSQGANYWKTENRKQESEGAEQRAHSKESRFKPSIIP
jgi:hypothetical protein